MKHLHKIWLFLLVFYSPVAIAQRTPADARNCPANIGFENGSLDNWECMAGYVLRDGSLNLSPGLPFPDRHTLNNISSQALDPYGSFPVNCPNGSGYSLRLGNSSAGGQAESVSYTFTIPFGLNDYSIIYNYAVVFQNPPHQPQEQPRFTSKIYNVTDNQYIDCGSFEFVASSGLPGFELSPVGNNVFFKPWSPVTVNLSGLAGKTVRLEFATNDCAFTQHFGYAYLDVNQDCTSGPVAGNTYCETPKSINLTAPFGFASYAWYPADFSQILGTNNVYTITPAPLANTTYALIIVPYQGSGCLDTLYTTINASNEPFNLNVIDEIVGCTTGVDLTSAAVTAGSSPGLFYSYYVDITQTNYIPIPSKVTQSGIYFIKGVNKVGCNDIKPIKVTIKDPPKLMVTNPAGVCVPQKIDITDPAITAGSEAGLQLSYWQNLVATIPLPTPNSIDKSGRYFIMAEKPGVCAIVQPVDVKIGEIPTIIIHNPTGCGKVDLTDPDVTEGSTPGIGYTYWADAAATVSLTNVNNITSTGTYYIKASSSSGCSIIRPILATVNPFPIFTVTDPTPVNYPVTTIDITTAVNQNLNLTYTYWLDSLTRKPVKDPRLIDKRGRYFIRATNEFGCSVIKAVNAVILPPPEPIVFAPNAFTPNNDGINDVFRIKIIGEISVRQLKIYSRWGQLVYDDANFSHNWNGKLKGVELPLGVYTWILQGMDTYFKKPFAHKGIITLVR
jgi:gliding motility-associated-like protein